MKRTRRVGVAGVLAALVLAAAAIAVLAMSL
jgi:hypothetical protein